MIALLLIACFASPDRLTPSLDPGALSLFAELGEDASVRTGGALSAAVDTALWRAWSEALPAPLRAVERFAGACDASGCQGIGEGYREALDPAFVAESMGIGVLRAQGAGLVGLGRRGTPFAFSMEPTRLWLGHASAARDARDPRRAWASEVPEGEAWVLALAPEKTVRQLDQFLATLPDGPRRQAALARSWCFARHPLEGVEALALSVRFSAPARVVLRARFETEAAARGHFIWLKLGLMAERRRTHSQPGLDALLDAATLVRVDERVELVLPGDDADALASLLRVRR